VNAAIDTPPDPLNVPARSEWQEEILAVLALLAARHGSNLTHVRREEISRHSVKSGDHRYIRHQFVDTGCPSADPINILVKYSPRKENRKFTSELDTYLTHKTWNEFSAPRYYGQLTALEQSTGAAIGVWEYIPREPTEMHLLRHPVVRAAVVNAAAAMTAIGREARQAVPGLPPNPKFVKPVAHRFARSAEVSDYFGLGKEVCDEQLSKLADFEQPAIAKLTDLGGYLTHNNLHPGNFLFRDNQPLVIYDWETTSLGAPGASLYVLAYLEEYELLGVAYHYCWFLGKKGVFLDPEEVVFAMRASAIFRLLNLHAFRSKSGSVEVRDQVAWALRSVDSIRV